MGFFDKKTDPISERAKKLNSEIAALEAEIKKLSSKSETAGPRLRSTAGPAKLTKNVSSSSLKDEANPKPFNEPAKPEVPAPLGVKSGGVGETLKKVITDLRGKRAANPKLVSYLAAGSLQGLRPLRYEKRVARNRFVFLTVILVIIVIGLLTVLSR